MRRFFVIPAGLVVLGLLAFNFLFVDLSISDCELIIDGIGGLLSSPVHELVVVEPMVEGVDHVMFLDKREFFFWRNNICTRIETRLFTARLRYHILLFAGRS